MLLVYKCWSPCSQQKQRLHLGITQVMEAMQKVKVPMGGPTWKGRQECHTTISFGRKHARPHCQSQL